jgi:hypothetical protein
MAGVPQAMDTLKTSQGAMNQGRDRFLNQASLSIVHIDPVLIVPLLIPEHPRGRLRAN